MARKRNRKVCTIYTDASYDQFKKIGQCAFHAIWKNKDGQQTMEGISEVFTAMDSFDAELIGVYFALKSVTAGTRRNEFLIRCDNRAVVNLLDHNGIIHRDAKMKYVTINQIKSMVYDNGYIIRTSYVRGHDDSNMSKASKLNRRVDMLSRTYKKE